MTIRYWVVVFSFIIGLSIIVPDDAFNSPFKRPTADVSQGQVQDSVVGRMFKWIQTSQLDLRRSITSLVRGFQAADSISLLLIFGASFLYGMIHALGPGHGKGIVVSYVLSEQKPGLVKGLATGCIIAFGEAISAVIIVYAIYFLALGKLTASFQNVEKQIRFVAYSMILVLGIALFSYRLVRHLQLFRNGSQTPDQSPYRHSGLFVVFLLGLIPCPGVMLLLIFMLTARLPVWGLVFAFSMACGMAVTISSFAVATVSAKSRLVPGVFGASRRLKLAEAAIELGGAGMIVILAVLMLAI